MFNAFLIEKDEAGTVRSGIKPLSEEQLPDGDVTVAVEYSTVNYKDGLCFTANGGGLVRNYPHVPGIDFAGTVESSQDARYSKGDKVVLTGWRVGETHWGGFSQKARVKADWLVRLPDNMTPRQAMGVGTAGIAAMFGILALEDHGLTPDKGTVLVTGAAGGVGSIAAAILSNMGYKVAGVTGRSESEAYLKSLGVSEIIPRDEVNEAIKRPLESTRWSGIVDAVGGEMLARVLGQLAYGGSASAIGNAGGAKVPASVMPFLLRGINLLGIDSVMQPYENRLRAWHRIAKDLPMNKLEAMITSAALADIAILGAQILKGQVQGRVVVDVNR